MQKALGESRPDYIIGEKHGAFSTVKKFLIGILSGAVVTAVMSAVFAAIMAGCPISDGFIPVFAYISLCLGALTAGIISVSLISTKGLFNGAVAGLLFFVFQLLLSLILGNGNVFSASLPVFLVIDVAFGAIGGVIRVNIRR